MAAINPDDESKPFVARWNSLISALLIEPSIKLVARTACDYGIMRGENIYPGNQRLARQTGYDERTVREAWHFLRGEGLAYRVEHSSWTGERKLADRYELVIPSSWRQIPMLGPHGDRFTCQQCGRKFNPQPCNTYEMRKSLKGIVPVAGKDGTRDPRWHLWKAAFCPTPKRGPDAGKGCFEEWVRAHGEWGGKTAWAAYRKARDDDWPAVAQLEVA